MTKTTVSLLCEQCDMPLEGPTDFNGNSSFTCNGCGLTDTYDAFAAEAKERLANEGQAIINAKMRDMARKSKILKLRPGNPVLEKTFRVKFSSDPLSRHR